MINLNAYFSSSVIYNFMSLYYQFQASLLRYYFFYISVVSINRVHFLVLQFLWCATHLLRMLVIVEPCHYTILEVGTIYINNILCTRMYFFIDYSHNRSNYAIIASFETIIKYYLYQGNEIFSRDTIQNAIKLFRKVRHSHTGPRMWDHQGCL